MVGLWGQDLGLGLCDDDLMTVTMTSSVMMISIMSNVCKTNQQSVSFIVQRGITIENDTLLWHSSCHIDLTR